MVSRPASPDPAGVLLERARARAQALACRTSLRVGGRPDLFFEPVSTEEAARALEACHAAGMPVRVLGGGCNLLVADGRLAGAVFATHRLDGLVVEETRVRAGAGVPFPGLVRRAADLRIPALSGCPGIPGSVGGVVSMNAGGRFGTVGDALLEVRGLDFKGRPFVAPVSPGDLGYRRSPFVGRLVTEAVFRRDPALDPAALRARYAEALQWKQRTQPLSARSAGCVFKNPDGPDGPRSAGRLIDAAGLKGARVGDAVVSDLHANFIVNAGHATAADGHALIRLVRARVRDVHGVELALEVAVWE